MKYALVTGSTKGIGEQIAIDLLKKGYFVIFNYSNDDSLIQQLKKELEIISPAYKIIKHDLSKINQIGEFINTVKTLTSELDVLVLNAGTTNRKDFYELTIEDWLKVINTNLSSPFFIVQGLGQQIKQNGNIIFIGSLLGIKPPAISIPYGISKAGLHMLSKNLVKIFNNRNITVNTVAPGFVETSWQKNKPKKIKENIINKIALHRFAYESEISSICLHLIDNRYINGQVLIVDGGYAYK
ncbi:MAG: SDR family NAD(P)-dependent oxidoreductase [Endomicrobium sp.]|jgi:3-oxoacyl-[acyl-carrier protein] reductase|uniref:SDR family NAD(P)-dependent oxidoreductase n=1 Tax=Candidatus Endomicrobiellum cubanum TaxID=3242325 RepID=UPI002827952A|nr:SDR family NAD(P)-dependent oxidoreductase [Endomicrobium sp.]